MSDRPIKAMTDLEEARVASVEQGIFLSYQSDWVADLRPVKFCEKSRRVGLTWAEAADDALHAAKATGSDVWYIGYNKDMALEFVGDAANWSRHYQLAASEIDETLFNDGDRDILGYMIRYNSGHRLTALSSRPTNLRGKQGRVVLDEAAFHENLPGLLKAAMALLIWGGDVRVISTHFGDDNPFNQVIQDIRAGRKNYGLHRITFDEALAAGLCRRVFQVLGKEWSPEAEAAWRQEIIDFYGDDADEELFVIPSQGSGVFLTRALIEQCMSSKIPVVRWAQKPEFTYEPERVRESVTEAFIAENLMPLLAKMDPTKRSYLGEDFGRLGDLSVLFPLQETQKATFRAPFILELSKIPFEQQKQIAFAILDRLPRFTHGAFDAGGNGHYLAEVCAQRYGEGRVSEIKLSDDWYRQNMPKYKAAFEDRSLLLPLDADIIDDHRAFKVIKGVAKLPTTRTKGADRIQRHGDSGVAGALAWFAIGQDTAEMPVIHSLPRSKVVGVRYAGF